MLVAVNDNFTYKTLANILFTTALENKLPDHLASTIKVVGFLITNKLTQSISTDLKGKITEKMLTISQLIMDEIDQECGFLKATTAEHSKHALTISDAAIKITLPTLNLVSSNQSFLAITKELQPAVQALSNASWGMFFDQFSITVTDQLTL